MRAQSRAHRHGASTKQPHSTLAGWVRSCPHETAGKHTGNSPCTEPLEQPTTRDQRTTTRAGQGRGATPRPPSPHAEAGMGGACAVRRWRRGGMVAPLAGPSRRSVAEPGGGGEAGPDASRRLSPAFCHRCRRFRPRADAVRGRFGAGSARGSGRGAVAGNSPGAPRGAPRDVRRCRESGTAGGQSRAAGQRGWPRH